MQLDFIKLDESLKKSKYKDETKLGFGQYFTDYLFTMEYDNSAWHSARIQPYHKLAMEPSSLVFHYGQQIFEGLKAYRGKNNKVLLFRAVDHIERLNKSAKRLCMPEVDVQFILDSLKTFIDLEKDWIPKSRGGSLYIRPVMIATEASLGVKVSSKYLFYIILSPAGAYYQEGFSPVRIYVCDDFVRAIQGGTGEAKTGGNYAASLVASQKAKNMGFTQVLWLDAKERKFVEEVGTMNIFFRLEDKVITPNLSGSIMPGITRDSTIKLLDFWGIKTEERPIEIKEIIDGLKRGIIKEVFGTGTAAIITPVKEISFHGKEYKVNNGEVGELTNRLFNEILGIQYGNIDDIFGWVEQV